MSHNKVSKACVSGTACAGTFSVTVVVVMQGVSPQAFCLSMDSYLLLVQVADRGMRALAKLLDSRNVIAILELQVGCVHWQAH
jgi:hypothetical protein